MTTDEGRVRYERRDTIVRITFDRPAARNAMTWSMYEQFAESLSRLELDDGVRVAVLRGEGGHFVAGTDIRQFSAFATADDGVAYERVLDDVVGTLERVRVPTVAVVEGHAAGGGLAMAAACDLRICTPDARFGVPIAKTVGNCLSMDNHARLVRHLGAARTTALLFTAGFMPADEALACGFACEIVQSHLLDARLDALTGQLAGHAPITLQVTKEALRRLASGRRDGDDLVRRAYGSRDFHEGVAAFLAKRPPQWEGR